MMPKNFFTLSQFAQAMSMITGRSVPEDYLRGMLRELGIVDDAGTPTFFYVEVCGLCNREGQYSRKLIRDIYESYFRPWSFFGDPPGGSALDLLTL
jgi:hypothetical protein